MRVPGDIDRLHAGSCLLCPCCSFSLFIASCPFPVFCAGSCRGAGQGIEPRVVHTGGDRPGRRIEILDLFGHIAQFPDIFGQGNGILQGAARMGRHEIGNDILVLAGLFVHLFKETDKFAVDLVAGLSHSDQNVVGDMLRRYPELAADMIFTEFTQKSPVLVRQEIVETES